MKKLQVLYKGIWVDVLKYENNLITIYSKETNLDTFTSGKKVVLNPDDCQLKFIDETLGEISPQGEVIVFSGWDTGTKYLAKEFISLTQKLNQVIAYVNKSKKEKK